jgi:hypothetical protein
MIFRRRTTDQVYSTLQQVQRRITEQGGQPVVGSGGNMRTPAPGSLRTPPPGSYPAAASTAPIGTPLRFPTPPPTPHAVPPASTSSDEPAPLGGMLVPQPPVTRFVLNLPLHLATTLLLLWLVTLVAAYFAGRSAADRTPAPMPRSEAPAPSPNAVEQPVRGNWVFLLQTVPTANSQLRAKWQEEVTRLNNVCRQNASQGWKPYFALREPENGGLQMVFGQVDGKFGIDQAQFTDFIRKLTAPPPAGAGFTQGRWLALDQ